MSMKILLFSLLISGNVFAANLKCRVLINLDVVNESFLVTKLKEKTLIGNHEQIITYVTETATDVFSIEAFVPELDARIYSEGTLKGPDEALTASVWARDVLAEVSCKKLK